MQLLPPAKKVSVKVMFFTVHLSVSHSVHGRRVWSLGCDFLGDMVLRRVGTCAPPWKPEKAGGTHPTAMLFLL